MQGWLAPSQWLSRCWRAWANTPPPAELAALLAAVTAGHPLNLYLPD